MQQFSRFFLLLVLLLGASALYAQDAILQPSEIPVKETNEDSANPLLVVTDIQISGYKKTKDYIIKREIPFKKGEYILKSQLKDKLVLSRQRLMNTSLFVDVEVGYTGVGDSIVINVVVKERWYLFPLPYFKIVGRNLNDWLFDKKADLKRTNYGFKFEQYNVSGRNDKLKLFLITGYSQDAILRYENPYLDKNLQHGMRASIGYSRNKEVNYAIDSNRQKLMVNPDKFLINIYNLTLSYTYKPAIKTRHHVTLNLTNVSVDSSVIQRNPRFFPQGRAKMFFPELGYGVEHYNVDYNPYPLKGFIGEGYFSMRMSTDYTSQVTLKTLLSDEIFHKSYLQFQGVGVLKLPFDQYYNGLGLMGGSDLYMRGLENYVIEGVAGGVMRGTAIREALNFTIRNPLKTKSHDKFPFKFMVKAYGDLGYAYKRPMGETTFFNNKLLYTYGAGIDVISIYDIVFKAEYSINQRGESGFFFHTKADF